MAIFADTKSFWLALVIPLLATLVIDLIAAYQTIFFMDMIGKCEAGWQVVVLSYGNLLLSLGLFSLAFPVVVVGLLWFENLETYKGKIEFQLLSKAQSQEEKSGYILYDFGQATADSFSSDEIAKNVTLWTINTEALDDTGKPTLQMNMGALISGNMEPIQLLSFLDDALRKFESDTHMRVVEQKTVPNFLILPHSELSVEVRHAFSSIPFASLYRIAFIYTSLLGIRSLEIAKGHTVFVE